MTDRYTALIVILDEPTRDDDAEHLIGAVRQLRNVRAVEGVAGDMLNWQAKAHALDEQRSAIRFHEDAIRRIVDEVLES